MIDKKNAAEMWQEFLELCVNVETPEALNQLFGLFLTFEERETLASRYSIVKALLDKQLTQRNIALAHQVSIAQITRGSNALKIIDAEFRQNLEKKIFQNNE